MNLLCRIDPPWAINQKILPGPTRVKGQSYLKIISVVSGVAQRARAPSINIQPMTKIKGQSYLKIISVVSGVAQRARAPSINIQPMTKI